MSMNTEHDYKKLEKEDIVSFLFAIFFLACFIGVLLYNEFSLYLFLSKLKYQ